MSGDPERDEDGTFAINQPLPVKSRKETLEWAVAFTRVMAEQTGAKILPDTESANFYDCEGSPGEVAEDGRFQLFYYVRGELPDDQHIAAVDHLRGVLETEGYGLIGLRHDPGGDRPVTLDAQNDQEGVQASAESTAQDTLTFTLITSCLLPPGVEQQQF